MSDLTGRQLGKYELREVIRRGGMSAVYEAYQPSLHRLVAVKVLAFPGDPEFAARFEREARAIAALQHPNVVRVYDYGEEDGEAYLVMQYVEGGVTLVDLLREPQAPIRCLELLEHVLAGLGYAHGQGIVHRDVKPSNVLMASPTWPMLADFGIAKLLAVHGQQLTATGVVAGTPAYMAPEQAFRLSVDARTDLYSAGVVLYEMVTGQVPFDAGTPVATLMLHAYEPPPPPRELNPALPEELEAVVLKALAKDPAERYQSAEEMGEAVQSVRTLLERQSSRVLIPPAERASERSDAVHGRPAEPDPLAAAYTSAVRAFSQGRFDQAIRQLEPVLAADPAYEDVQTLLDAARAAHQAQRFTPPRVTPPQVTPPQVTPPRVTPPPGYPPVAAPAPADPAGPPTQPTPPPGYPPRVMPPGYTPQGAPAPGPPAPPGPVAPAWPPAGSGAPPDQPPPRRGRRGSAGGWFEERRRLAFVLVAVAALLGGSIWGAGLFGANQAQAREIILSARDQTGPDPFTPPVARPKTKPFGSGAIGTDTHAKSGVLQLHGDQVGLYGGTQNQSTCYRDQMIAFLRQNPAKAAAWVAALNSDPTLRWSGGTKVTEAQIPAYIHELTPVLLRLDTRVTNNGYRNGHPTPFQAVLQAGTAVLIDQLGVPRSRCACGNPLLEPKDLTKTSQYSGAAWPGFKAATIVTVAPAAKQINNVMLVDVDKGTNAVFDRTTGSAGDKDVTVKLTAKLKTEINLTVILQDAQVVAPPPSTELPASSTAAGPTDTSGSSSSESTVSEPSSETTTTTGGETSSTGTETSSSSSSETTSSQPDSSSTETTVTNDTTTTIGGSTSSEVTSTSLETTTTTAPPSSSTSEAATSSLPSTNANATAAVIPAVYLKGVNAQLPSQPGYRVAFRCTWGGWQQGWTRCESRHERPDRSQARTV